MGKKMLAILAVAAVAGYVFRDRIIAGVLTLGGKVNQFVEDVTDRVDQLNTEKERRDDDF